MKWPPLAISQHFASILIWLIKNCIGLYIRFWTHVRFFHAKSPKLRSRLTWLSQEDANTNYFHIHASHRRRKNFIGSLKDGHQVVSLQKDIEDTIYQHYKQCLGIPMERPFKLDLDFFWILIGSGLYRHESLWSGQSRKWILGGRNMRSY
jgi:hypothetical protein